LQTICKNGTVGKVILKVFVQKGVKLQSNCKATAKTTAKASNATVSMI
jgi:hypothetical protein